MKSFIIYKSKVVFIMLLATLYGFASMAQENETKVVDKPKPVKNTFESVWLIDNQTVLVPVKGTFEMDIMHRFGTVEKGYDDFFGLYAPSNIRMGFSYVPVKKLNIGVGLTKHNMLWDGSLKYSILTQEKGKGGYPVSVSYYANAAYDTRKKENFFYSTERLTFFHQLLVARKISDRISLQVAPSVSHVNAVYGYFSDTAKIAPEMKHDHFAVALSGRYKIKEGMALMFNYDQPVTKHPTNNPNPNISFGLELNTSAHSFQVFMGNYSYLNPQRNNMFNTNNYEKGAFLIGFNITRLWNY